MSCNCKNFIFTISRKLSSLGSVCLGWSPCEFSCVHAICSDSVHLVRPSCVFSVFYVQCMSSFCVQCMLTVCSVCVSISCVCVQCMFSVCSICVQCM